MARRGSAARVMKTRNWRNGLPVPRPWPKEAMLGSGGRVQGDAGWVVGGSGRTTHGIFSSRARETSIWALGVEKEWN